MRLMKKQQHDIIYSNTIMNTNINTSKTTAGSLSRDPLWCEVVNEVREL